MLFGFVFNITIVSTMVNVLFSINLTVISNLFSILIPMLVITIIIVFMRVPKVRAWGDRIIERIAGKLAHRETGNSVLLLDYLGEDSIAQVKIVDVPEAFRDKTLAEMGLKGKHNILVMLIEKPGKKPVAANAKTMFRPGDKLTVFGDYKTVCNAFEAKERFEEEI